MRKIVLLMTFMYINCATIAFAKPYQDKEHYNIHYNNQPYSKVKEEYLEERVS